MTKFPSKIDFQKGSHKLVSTQLWFNSYWSRLYCGNLGSLIQSNENIRQKMVVIIEMIQYDDPISRVEFLPQGEKANREYYKGILKRLREKNRKNWPQLWLKKLGNASAYSVFSISQFLSHKSDNCFLPASLLFRPLDIINDIKINLLKALKNKLKEHFHDCLWSRGTAGRSVWRRKENILKQAKTNNKK